MQQLASKENNNIFMESKIVSTKELLLKIYDALAAKGKFNISITSIAPYAELSKEDERSRDEFTRELQKINTKLETVGRPSWFGARATARFETSFPKNQAIILITDAGFYETKNESLTNAIEVFKRFRLSNPNAYLGIISAANTLQEKANLEQIVKAGSGNVVYPLEALLSDDIAFNNFINDVFWSDCISLDEDLKDIYFDFDKANLTKESITKLNKAIDIINAQYSEQNITLIGWTDYFGSNAYNYKLSEKRAITVKDYLISHGINPNRLSISAQGKSFKYSNQTEIGRLYNRRVEIKFTNNPN